MCFNEEENDMSTVQERLSIANEKVDSVIDDLWAKGEKNLKRLESEFKNRVEGSKRISYLLNVAFPIYVP